MSETKLIDKAIADYWENRANFLLGMLTGATGMTEEEINEKWTEQIMRMEDKEYRAKILRLIPGGKKD